mgnify:CR=1 FL=1
MDHHVSLVLLQGPYGDPRSLRPVGESTVLEYALDWCQGAEAYVARGVIEVPMDGQPIRWVALSHDDAGLRPDVRVA